MPVLGKFLKIPIFAGKIATIRHKISFSDQKQGWIIDFSRKAGRFGLLLQYFLLSN